MTRELGTNRSRNLRRNRLSSRGYRRLNQTRPITPTSNSLHCWDRWTISTLTRAWRLLWLSRWLSRTSDPETGLRLPLPRLELQRHPPPPPPPPKPRLRTLRVPHRLGRRLARPAAHVHAFTLDAPKEKRSGTGPRTRSRRSHPKRKRRDLQRCPHPTRPSPRRSAATLARHLQPKTVILDIILLPVTTSSSTLCRKTFRTCLQVRRPPRSTSFYGARLLRITFRRQAPVLAARLLA